MKRDITLTSHLHGDSTTKQEAEQELRILPFFENKHFAERFVTAIRQTRDKPGGLDPFDLQPKEGIYDALTESWKQSRNLR